MMKMIGWSASLATLAASMAAPASAATVEELQAQIAVQEARIQALEGLVQKMATGGGGGVTAATEPMSAPPAVVVPPLVLAAQPSAAAAPRPDEATIKLRGRVQADALLVNSGGGGTPTGTQMRRFYIGAEGMLAPKLRYVAEADLAGAKTTFQEVMVGYQATDAIELVGGYLKPQITADDILEDTQTVFLERSTYAGVFAPGRRVGAGVNYAANGVTIRGGVYGERDDSTLDVNRSESWVASLRASANLLPGKDVLHVALSTYYTEPSATDHAVAFSQRPESNRALVDINTGTFAADHGVFAGGELAYSHGPFLIQAEGGQLAYEGGAAPTFSGWSAMGSWRLTGEARPYDPRKGVFGRVTPLNSISNGGLGAFELGLRSSMVDLNSGPILGGKLTTYGAVLNWYPVQRLRLGANLIRANTQRPGQADTEQTLLTIRGAADW